jgi:hypothetical protein
MTKITINLNAQVEGGPTISSSLSRDVEAYDYIDAVIPAGEKSVTVQLQPSANQDLQFLLIQASGAFEPDTVTYGGENGDKVKIALNESHLYLGETNIKLLGNTVNELKFKNASKVNPNNKTKTDAKLKILVGRDPTPAP